MAAAKPLLARCDNAVVGVKNSLDQAGYTAWPQFEKSGMPPILMILEGKKGEPAKPVIPLDLNLHPILEGNYIIPKTVEYIKRNASAKKPSLTMWAIRRCTHR
jgi:hypothetical protein